MSNCRPTVILLTTLASALSLVTLRADNWPRWRGPDGKAISNDPRLPVRWSPDENVCWATEIPGEGSSSPIVWNDRAFLSSALEDGTRRLVHCLDRKTGDILWSGEIDDENPELTSALTGHAAATPATDGEHVIAFFGNAGVVCYDFDGNQRWRRRFGEFDSELGLASSPVLHQGRVILLCDHDGNRFRTFDSFLIALDVGTGDVAWKTDRKGQFRSWSTPIPIRLQNGRQELVINAQDELRGYDPETGKHLWSVRGMTGWVTPSPVSGLGLVLATSGKDGPTMAVRPGGTGDVTDTHVVWQHRRGAPYVCSPLLYDGLLYVHNEQGILSCMDSATGEVHYQERLDGKFIASAVAVDGKIYVSNEDGDTFVFRAGNTYELLARNPLRERCLASPAISDGQIFIRTERHLFCIANQQ
jgi:hypothetical protein